MVFLGFLPFTPARAQSSATPADARAIAMEDYIYGFAMVDCYRIMHAYFVDRANPQYTGEVESYGNENK